MPKPDPLAVSLGPKDHGQGPWIIDLRFEAHDERLECVEVRLRAEDVKRSITTAVWRRFRPAEMIDEGRRRILRKRRQAGLDVTSTSQIRRIAEEYLSRERRAGPRLRYGPQHWVDVVTTYEDARAAGKPPTKAVAERWGVESSTAGKWVAKCREMELLSRTTPGKPSGRIIYASAALTGRGHLSGKGEVIDPKRKSKRRS